MFSEPRARPWLAGFALVLGLFVLGYLDREPYDDAHFFKRVALNALEHHTLAWNLDEGPVYGSTSQTMQALALLTAAIARQHTMLLTRGLAVAMLIAAVALLDKITLKSDEGISALCAFCAPALLFPALSGMETALALLALSVLLVLLYSAPGRARHFSLAPLLALFIYLTRPDAVLLAAIPLLVERWAAARRFPLRELGILLLGGGVLLGALRWYYGTALPLPFYAKQAAFTPYDASFLELSQRAGRQRFTVFAVGALPLFLGALLRRDRTNLTLLGSAVAFVGYHLAFTVDVMGMHGRFYVPCVPLLVLASARAAEVDAGRWRWPLALGYLATIALLAARYAAPFTRDFGFDDVPALFTLAALAAGSARLLLLDRARLRAWLAGGVLLVTGVAALSRFRPRAVRFYGDDDYLALQTAHTTVFRGLDTLRACFGDKLHVYHSEVGVPGLRFPSGKVTDFAGLLSPAWLFHQTDFEQACRTESPDAIFLPHKNYVELNRRIRASPCLRRYERVVRDSSSPLYVRHDLAQRYRDCGAERQDPFVLPFEEAPRVRRRF